MNNSINHILSFDSGINNLEEIIDDQNIRLPVAKNRLTKDVDNFFLSLAISHAAVQSMDYEIEETILSSIEDMETLSKNPFRVLLDETRFAIEKDINKIQDPDTKQSLYDLLDLLNESADLVSLLQSYTNWLQKA